MAELIATAAAAEIARSVNDITRACVGAGAAVIAREGISPNVLGYLAASTVELLPSAPLIDGLTVSHALEGTWTSPFMANFMGVQQVTTQQALLSEHTGKKLVIYATALAGVATPRTVRGILREHLAVTLGLSQVAEVPESIYHVCVHSPTLQLLQHDIASNFERCAIAFSETDTGNSRRASYRELAVIAIAFAAAQKRGPKHWVRVKNLIGAEALCAALGTAFIADVTVGAMRAVVPSAHPALPASTKTSARTLGMVTGAGIVTSNSPNIQSSSLDGSIHSTTAPTSIRFEYDASGVVAIGICETGAPIRDYIVPEGGVGRPSRNSMLGGELLAIAKIKLDYDFMLPWICKGAMGAYTLRRLAEELVIALGQYENGACKAMVGNLVGKWMEAYVRETGGTREDYKVMQTLLVKASTPDINPQVITREVELLAGPDHAKILSKMLGIPSASNNIQSVLVMSLFEALFGPCYTGLEFNLNLLDYFMFPSDLHALIPEVFNLLPAFDVPVTVYRPFSPCCSVVQCGGYVLMPRILAEEKIGDVNNPPFIMAPGQLAKDGVPVAGFFYDEQHSDSQIDALKPEASVPSNASDSNDIDYLYEEADYGYKFYTVEAGHRLNLDGLIEGVLFMHQVDDQYEERAALTHDWQRAAPHHMIPRDSNHKTIFLAYGNTAGRRLALSRAGDAGKIAAAHMGIDYGRALAYANQHGCMVAIL